ncbi:MAG TPA: selenobiotic family peptide radical SAM maturase [Nitrospiraceae bacterium]|nr:selenobiotic family peptide radical SAM maturase [Nitrospiraceae bacterium]
MPGPNCFCCPGRGPARPVSCPGRRVNSRMQERLHTTAINEAYPLCRSVVGADAWKRAIAACGPLQRPEDLPEALRSLREDQVPMYLPDLARLEMIRRSLSSGNGSIKTAVETIVVNPTVQIVEVAWTGLTDLFGGDRDGAATKPVPGSERVLAWREPATGTARIRPARDEDFLVLKVIMEERSPDAVAAEGGIPVGAIEAAINRAVESGLLLAPPSQIRRDPEVFRKVRESDEELLSSSSFTLQWHITQACDLHCKHCYDRTERSFLSLEQAVSVLDDLRDFCKARHVQGAVSFTGGNPLLHPQFIEIYQAAAVRGFSTAILGNPTSRERMGDIISIQMPSFFQVSLEGLAEHNDAIRGSGHFDRVMRFLDVLRELDVYSMVMLTLTNENIDQVIPLAEALRTKVDVFHCNRLALFGEGANLTMPDRKKYRAFLESYCAAAALNPIMGLKENLINILRHEKGQDLFGGCTGHGCGAAFNFVSLLADGEVHACRKFPSLIGNIGTHGLAEIYDSDLARRFRLGPTACRDCTIRAACGGCLASASSSGLNIFQDKDPFCFLSDSAR